MRSPAPLFLALLTLAAGCVVVHDGVDYEWSIDDWETASREETAELAIASGDRLVIGGASGDVTVRVAKDVAPHFVAKVTGHGETVADAERVRDAFRVVTERSGRDVIVRVVGEPVEFGDENVKMTLEAQVAFSVIVPEGVALDLRTNSGDIAASGPFLDCALDSAYGDVAVTDANGTVTAASNSGDVRLKNVTGPLAEARSSYGDVELASVRAERIVAKTNSGEVTLAGTDGATEVHSGYGDVTIDRAKGPLAATSSSGDVVVRRFSARDGGPAKVEVDTGYGKVELDGAFASLDAVSASGDVTVIAREASRVAGAWRVRSGYGNVALTLPGDVACEIDARTNYGTIETDFAVRVEAGKVSGKEIRGRIGEGAATGTLRLESSSGDIALRRLPAD